MMTDAERIALAAKAATEAREALSELAKRINLYEATGDYGYPQHLASRIKQMTV